MANFSVCGADCASCAHAGECGGCAVNQGRPFFLKGELCEVFECASKKRIGECGGCNAESCSVFRSVIPEGVADSDLYVRQKAYNLKERNRERSAGLGIRFGEYSVKKAPGRK